MERERKDKALLKNNLGELPYKNCPKCRTLIEKYAGCNAMKCTQCAIAFCWRCSLMHDEDGEFQLANAFVRIEYPVFFILVHYHYGEKNSPCYNQCFDEASNTQ